MRRREPADLASLLLRKALEDEVAVRELLLNRDVSDEIVAFHAQQSIEKALKAVLALREVRYGRTHDLGALMQMAKDAGIAVPGWMEEAEALTPFGVLFRYEDLSAEPEAFDRKKARDLAGRVRAWAEGVVEASR